MEDEEVNRPRLIDTFQYVKDRISQISELLEVVDNSSLPPGGVTSRKRTVLQRLPRHMRRRAMSHNIKRLPKMIRNLAVNAIMKAKHRKKPPSRKWRRRPSRLLKRRSRMLRKFNWLETHIWHAKRFRMTDLWGYRLPLQSYQKGFRPTYRSAVSSTVVFDYSFLECIQITSYKSQEEIFKLLSSFCVSGLSPSFGFKAALKGCIEMSVLLYMPNQYPHGFLGPGRFSWSSTDASHRIHLWVHPSVRSLILSSIVEMFGAKALEPMEVDKVGSEQSESKTSRSFISSHFAISDMSHDIVRIQLVGPKSLALLQCAFELVSSVELIALGIMEHFRASHDFWSSKMGSAQPGNFKNGTIISLLLEDPRLFRASKQKKVGNMDSCPSESLDAPPTCVLFWDECFRKQQLQKRLSSAELVRRRAEKLKALKTTPFKVPVLIVIRNAATNKGGALANRVDLIAPGGTGLDFWLALQFAGGRAAGLRDKIHLDFEAGLTSFPLDCADSQAGLKFAEMDSVARLVRFTFFRLQSSLVNSSPQKAKYLKKPQNRRINYEQSLHVKYPFSFEWSKLVEEWSKVDEQKHCTAGSDPCHVVRSRRVLISLNKWLEGENVERKAVENLLKEHSRALVPVKMEQLSRGIPKRLALICLPNEQDILVVGRDRNTTPQEEIVEVDSNTQVHEKNSEDDVKLLPDYISLRLESGEKLVSLNEMFPDQPSLKHHRNVKKREKKKLAVKRKKMTGYQTCASDQLDAARVEESKLLNPECFSYKNTCSRILIGRVVRGDYSFIKAQGVSFGYCPVAALEKVQKRLVMLRNVDSKFYHPARISINFHQYDL